jgi:glycosyltransferase involved in cell wall biosynthesis
MMRIVLSNASYAWGGVHQVTETLARGLQARGHEVVVFVRPDSPLEERMRAVAPVEPILKGMDLSPLAIGRAAAALRRHRPQVVLTLMKKDVRITAPAARALGVPVVVRHANDRPFGRSPHYRLLYGSIAAHHVANSHATRETLLRSAGWLAADDVSVIHNGIDLEPFASARAAELPLPAGALAIGFIGRFDERKGLLDLARAWPAVAAALPAAHLVLVGKGPAEDAARALLGDAPRVLWLGFRPDVAAVLKAMDLLAVPSHWEGFGLVAAEALAAGVPVVAADASSLPEIVRDGREGLLVPPGDVAALSAALIRLGADPAERERLGAAGPPRIAAEFALDGMIDRYEALLLRLAARSK